MTDRNEQTGKVPDLFDSDTESLDEDTVKFEERLTRLEEIVSKMEGGGLSLAEAMKLYKEGSAHLAALTRTLGGLREQVVKLVRDEDGETTLESYTGEEAS